MADKKTATKKVVKYEITKPNGLIIYRSANGWRPNRKKVYEAKGCKVKEITE